jgi:hypothetical protein
VQFKTTRWRLASVLMIINGPTVQRQNRKVSTNSVYEKNCLWVNSYKHDNDVNFDVTAGKSYFVGSCIGGNFTEEWTTKLYNYMPTRAPM